MGSEGATCAHTLSDATRDLTKEEWDALRFGQACTHADNLANWIEAILQLCKTTKRCTWQEVEQLETLRGKLADLSFKMLL